MPSPAWLPDISCLEDFGGDWNRYFESVYEQFRRDFVLHRPSYRGEELALKRHPLTDNKEATFWHLISDGKVEDDRLPDLRRCERISWARAVIEHCDDEAVRVWETVRGTERRTLLWLFEEDYVVVLAVRSGYTLMWTAYVVKPHRKKAFQKEYEDFIRPRNG